MTSLLSWQGIQSASDPEQFLSGCGKQQQQNNNNNYTNILKLVHNDLVTCAFNGNTYNIVQQQHKHFRDTTNHTIQYLQQQKHTLHLLAHAQWPGGIARHMYGEKKSTSSHMIAKWLGRVVHTSPVEHTLTLGWSSILTIAPQEHTHAHTLDQKRQVGVHRSQ